VSRCTGFTLAILNFKLSAVDVVWIRGWEETSRAYQLPLGIWDVFRPPWAGEYWQAKPLIDPTGDVPSGHMASRAGRRLSPKEVRASLESAVDEALPFDDQDLARIWAYEIPELINREFSTVRAEGLFSGLGDLLASCLAIECSVVGRFAGALEKYGLLDMTVPAPPFFLGGVPMVIAVCADLVHIGDYEVASARQLDALKRRVTPAILGTWPATARVRAATYANLSGLHVGVGFFM
jgi:hypothetical protein